MINLLHDSKHNMMWYVYYAFLPLHFGTVRDADINSKTRLNFFVERKKYFAFVLNALDYSSSATGEICGEGTHLNLL